jgi:hypothetical protein
MAKNKAVVQPVAPVVAPVQADFVGQPNSVEVVEKLTAEDKNSLDMVKLKQELALSNAKTAVAQVELAKQVYDNFIFQLAHKYKLSDGDQISENGEVQRLSQGQ